MQPRKPRILLAEDHEDTRDLLVLVLEQENYEIAASSSVSGSFELLQSQNFDLIMLDSRLNDGSGLELCRTIRKIDQVTPILFYSALAFDKDRREALNAGASGYLVKPVNVSELYATVAELISNSRGAVSPLAVVTRKDSGELLLTVSV